VGAKEEVYGLLDSLKIPYQVTNHKAVFTVEQGKNLYFAGVEDICKNLFLRDDKGKRYFLVVMVQDKKADLKEIQSQLDCRRLSFASRERLMKYLGLKAGEVTPFGILNDAQKAVEIVFDSDLVGAARLGVHPNDNTATVWISFENLK